MPNDACCRANSLSIRRVLTAAALVIGAVSVVASLVGQPLFRTVDSVETLAANARIIVVGRVARFERVVEYRAPGFPLGLPAELDVDETLKGIATPGFTVPLPVTEQSLSRWRDSGARLLVAVPKNDRTPAVVVDLVAPNMAAVTADLKILRTPAEVTRAVREAVRLGAGKVDLSEGFAISVPHALVAGTELSSGVTNVLVRVPIDARLERRALAVLRGEQVGYRSEAVRALRYFRSESNVRVLTALLADPELATTSPSALGVELQVYHVRREALEILKSWGLAPPEPILQVETYRPELVESAHWVSFKKPMTVAEFQGLRRFPNLRRLVLMSAQLPAGAFQEIALLRGLRELDLGYSSGLSPLRAR